ncbi:hypothetical protein Tco_0162455 [Tanacetum coccineum]
MILRDALSAIFGLSELKIIARKIVELQCHELRNMRSVSIGAKDTLVILFWDVDANHGVPGASDEEIEGDQLKDQPLSSSDDDNDDDDDDDDDVQKDEEEEEEEEHLASVDPSAVPTDDPVPSS